MEFTQPIGVGVGDLQHAALTEARRLVREAGGDRAAAVGLVYDRLQELGLVSVAERDVLRTMHEIGTGTAVERGHRKDGDRPNATAAYLEVRGTYDQLLAAGDTGPVALTLAAGVVGSYEAVPSDDGTTVVYAKSTNEYQGLLGGAGAIIGGVLGGGPGAALGGAIGTVVGHVVDDCKD